MNLPFLSASISNLLSASFFLARNAAASPLPEGCEHCDAMVPLMYGWPDLFYLRGSNAVSSHEHAGKTLCIPAGHHWSLAINGVWGLPGQPVTIANCGGTVVFDGQKPHPTSNAPRGGTPLSIKNCTHLRLTGNLLDFNNADNKGIIFENAPYNTHGVHVHEGSSDIEIDHIVSRNHGYGGIVIRTYPGCGGLFQRDTFEQRNTHVHNTIISNVRGEGMYIGTSHYHNDDQGYVYGSHTACPGETGAEASLRVVRIYNNTLSDIGMDAIQIGAAVEDVSVHHNTIERFATRHKYGHSHGIAMNPGSTGDVYSNWIRGPLDAGTEPTTAIAYYGQGEPNLHSAIYNNIIQHVDQAFVFYNREDAVNQSYEFSFNTVYNFMGRSPTKVYCLGTVDWANQPPVSIQIQNNVFALGPEAVVLQSPNSSNGWSGWKAFYGNTNGVPGHPSMACLDYVETRNQNAWALAEEDLPFQDVSSEDFCIVNPLPSDPGSDWVPDIDFDGTVRSDPPDQGALEAN